MPYTLDEDDDEWLKNFNNSKRKGDSLTEDQFETIMYQLEKHTDEKVPFLALDPAQTPPLSEYDSLFTGTLAPLKIYLKSVYPHWKTRREQREGKPIVPHLVSEENDKNEGDPYVCFRRREIKSVRKTRRSDAQSLEKLRRLRTEMEQARTILERVCRRERLRKESLALEQDIFNQRVVFKDMKRKLGIKEADEELFGTAKKKRKLVDMSGAQIGASGVIKIPGMRKSKGLEGALSFSADLSTIPPPGQSEAEIAQRERDAAIRREIETELQKHLEANYGWEDITDHPYYPWPKSTAQSFYRRLSTENGYRNTSFRRRVGRGGRAFLDRRVRPEGTVANWRIRDRFRYDDSWSSEEDEDGSGPYQVVDDSKLKYQKFRAQLLKNEEISALMTSPAFLTTAYPTPAPTTSAANLAKALQGSKYGASGQLRTPNGTSVVEATGQGGSGVAVKNPGGVIPSANSLLANGVSNAAVKKGAPTQNGRASPINGSLKGQLSGTIPTNGAAAANGVQANTKLSAAQLQLNQLMAANLLQQQQNGANGTKLNNAQAMRLMAIISQQQQQAAAQVAIQQQQNAANSPQAQSPTQQQQQQLAMAAIIQAAQQQQAQQQAAAAAVANGGASQASPTPTTSAANVIATLLAQQQQLQQNGGSGSPPHLMQQLANLSAAQQAALSNAMRSITVPGSAPGIPVSGSSMGMQVGNNARSPANRPTSGAGPPSASPTMTTVSDSKK